MLALLSIPRMAPVVECTCLSFAGSVLLGDALLHLLPHSLEGADHGAMGSIGLAAVAGAMSLLVVPEVLHNHDHDQGHGHEGGHGGDSSLGVANLVTEGLHNYVDGITLGLSWVSGSASGIAATIAVAVHELPQELGDFMVLRAAGFGVGKLLFWNFLVSLTCVGGVGTVHILGEHTTKAMQNHLTAFTAGTFLTLSLNMIFPQVSEIIREKYKGKSAIGVRALCVALGFLAVWVLVKVGELESHDHGDDHGHDHSHGHGHGHSHGKEL